VQKVHTSPHQYEQAIRSLHDHLYGNSNLREPEALHTEVAKVLRVMLDAAQNGARGEPVHAADTGRLRAIFKQTHGPSATIELDDKSIGTIVERLAFVDFRSSERDLVGDALEVMRSTAAKRLGGQFFTDQRVTRLAVELLDYAPARHDFVDICSGTGGFLIAAAAAARHAKGEHAPILGTEIDPKIAALAQAALSELNTGSIRVFKADSLGNSASWNGASEFIGDGRHRRLASNPPFGIKILVTDPDVLASYELARAWRKSDGRWEMTERVVPRPPDILFMERNLQLARPGEGRAALVTPYQTLSGPKLGFVREWLLRNARILAVVDLPEHTFQPWTGTKTSLLVFERRAQPLNRWDAARSQDGRIFAACTRHIGHDRRGKPVEDGEGRIVTDLPAVGRAWRSFRRGKDPAANHPDAFAIDPAAISSESDLRLNAAFHHPRATGLRTRVLRARPSDVRVVRLGDVVEDIWCPGRFKRRYTDDAEGGTLFLGGSNICQFYVTNRKYMDPADPRLDQLAVREGWILVTRSGSTGIVSRVSRAWAEMAISDHVIRIAPAPEKLDPDYLEAFLRSPWGQQLMSAGIFGSVIDEITPEFLADLPIPVPTDREALAAVAKPQAAANRARDKVELGIGSALRAVDEVLGRHLR
jgi:type I restriction enzyme M protein